MKYFIATIVLSVLMITGQLAYMTKLEVMAGRLNINNGDWIKPCTKVISGRRC